MVQDSGADIVNRSDSGQVASAEDSGGLNPLVRVDVKIQNAPADFFGAAFDLVITGGEWSLKKYEAGEVFGNTMNPPLMLAV